MKNQLEITQFGNPILRKRARIVKNAEIKSQAIQNLIGEMRSTLLDKNLGVGLAAPQIGIRLKIAVIAIRPSKHRPTAEPFDLVLINPKITDYSGEKSELWEGCISAGSKGTADLFAKVPRYSSVTVEYTDEKAIKHSASFSGLVAQVIQHESDHLNGVLFVDHVTDTKSYMTYNEYLKLIVNRFR